MLIKAYWLKKIEIYYRCKIKIATYHVRCPTCGLYILQSLQLQFSPLQRLKWLLKIESVLACLIIFGKVDQSLFPRKDIVSIPYARRYRALNCNQYSAQQKHPS